MIPPDGEERTEPPPPPAVDASSPPSDPASLPSGPSLERDLERDLSRGRRVVALTWLVALLHAGLGLVAVRQAALLVDLDSDLVTTASVEAFGQSFWPVRIGLIVAIALFAVLAVRWLRGIVPTLERLADLGAVDGRETGGDRPVEPAAQGGLRRLGTLLRPAGVSIAQVSWADVRVGSGRRLAIAAVALVAVAAIAGAAWVVGLLTATDVAAARVWRLVAVLDAGLWLAATVVVGAVVADIGWRAAVAGRAVGIFAPLSDAPGRLLVRLTPALLIFGGLVPIAATGTASGAASCPADSLTCAAVIVPVDHRGGASQDSITIVYGVHEAIGDPRGTFVVAVGGPGGSGLALADGMLETFDDELVSRFDIVFWDQRGTGESDGHDCPVSGGIYSTVDTTPESARAFVTACLNEAQTGTSGLARYSTAQAAEDLESIRERLGVDRFVLYGESYGTELAQVYAAAHPDRLSALILDGAVDLTLSANDFWATATLGFEAVLSTTLDACRSDYLCSADVEDATDAYDRLLYRLGRHDLTVSYADPDGIVRPHTLSRAALEAAVGSLLYEPSGRSLIQRAVAASAGGDDVPATRLANLFGFGFSPVSTFAYHAILCADYRVSPTSDTTDVEAVLANGRKSGALEARTADVYLAQLPCLYWPDQPVAPDRPAPLTDLPVPIFVLGATMDPITPIDLGRSIAERASDAYLVVTQGGPHVTFGRGYPCVDRVVTRFLVEDRLPGRVTHCTDVVADPYIPLSPIDASAFEDAMDAMASLENELIADPLYTFWGGSGDFTIGCRFDGYIAVSVSDAGDQYEFEDCEYARGMVVSGTGGYDAAGEELTFDVSFAGGSLEYSSSGTRTVTGTFRNKKVDLRE
jgi:pimeloyl-ACP methyl ester carboxylesterase